MVIWLTPLPSTVPVVYECPSKLYDIRVTQEFIELITLTWRHVTSLKDNFGEMVGMYKIHLKNSQQ